MEACAVSVCQQRGLTSYKYKLYLPARSATDIQFLWVRHRLGRGINQQPGDAKGNLSKFCHVTILLLQKYVCFIQKAADLAAWSSSIKCCCWSCSACMEKRVLQADGLPCALASEQHSRNSIHPLMETGVKWSGVFVLQVREGRAAGEPFGAAATKGGLCLSSCVGLVLERVGRVGGCLQDTNKRRFFVALWVEA